MIYGLKTDTLCAFVFAEQPINFVYQSGKSHSCLSVSKFEPTMKRGTSSVGLFCFVFRHLLFSKCHFVTKT